MYQVRYSYKRPELSELARDYAWQKADTAELSHFRPEGSNHRPATLARLLYNEQGIYGLFEVQDRYVRSIRTRYGEPVYKDSCVEFFVRPRPDKGYFNFEFNCSGTMLCSYITDPERTAGGFREFILIPEHEGAAVEIAHSMPDMVEPEIADPVEWNLAFFIPFSLLEKYVCRLGSIPGQQWSANFYKCGDETSHPHWASWQPLPRLNFHMPDFFGTISFSSK